MLATETKDGWLVVWPGFEARFSVSADGIHIERVTVKGDRRMHHNELVLSFEDAIARAEGQLTFNLI